jgi:5-methylcytosine-specific restriction protein A
VRKHIPTTQRTKLLNASGGKCAECSAEFLGKPWHLDHVIPLEMGGPDVPSNWQCLCVQCHKDKTKDDMKDLAKAKRREAKNTGAKAPAKAQFPKREKPPGRIPDKLPLPPRRSIYQ